MSEINSGLLDSQLPATRTYWREKLKFSQEIVDDPRPIAECAPWYIERVNNIKVLAMQNRHGI